MTKRTGQKGKPLNMVLSVQLPTALVDALDAEAERMRAERPGVKVTRSDAIRALLHDALSRRQPPPKPE